MDRRLIYRFVLHQEIKKYEAMGYRFASYIRGYHGQYSVIMERIDDTKKLETRQKTQRANRVR